MNILKVSQRSRPGTGWHKIKQKGQEALGDFARVFPPLRVLALLSGTAVISFGIYNIHKQVSITEGGVLGMILLSNHWLGLSPALLSPLLDGICYFLGFRYLGRDFLKTSVFATVSFAGFSWLWEQFPPALPDLSASPLAAALLGGCFIGIGCGLVVRQGASSGGDDALALIISKLSRCRISRAYLITDFTVLALSLSYIPWQRLIYSLVTVTVSSFLIEFIQKLGQKPASLEDNYDII